MAKGAAHLSGYTRIGMADKLTRTRHDVPVAQAKTGTDKEAPRKMQAAPPWRTTSAPTEALTTIACRANFRFGLRGFVTNVPLVPPHNQPPASE